MGNSTEQFAKLFRRKREKHSFSLWELGKKIDYHPRNIQKIEHAERQPGVLLAVRLVAALDENVGDFFEELHQLCIVEGNLPTIAGSTGKSKKSCYTRTE